MWLDIIEDAIERVQLPHEPVAVVLMTHVAYANPIRAGRALITEVMRRASQEIGLPFALGPKRRRSVSTTTQILMTTSGNDVARVEDCRERRARVEPQKGRALEKPILHPANVTW